MEPLSDSNTIVSEVPNDLGKRICKKLSNKYMDTLELSDVNRNNSLKGKSGVASTHTISEECLSKAILAEYQGKESGRKQEISHNKYDYHLNNLL